MSVGRPLVSAVIPVHNAAEFVGEAIASVLAQTYEPLECIAVDDGSTDASADVIRGFGERVRCVSQPNRGASAARNAGVAAAGGELIAFLDADDLWDPTKIERQQALFEERPELGLVYCGLRLIDREGNELRCVPAADPSDALRNTLLNEPPFVSLAQTGLIPRRVLLACGGFDEAVRTAEDSELTWRLVTQFPIAAVQLPLASYRRHPAQKHLDIAAFEYSSRIMLRKAFAAGVLPPEVQRLERRARANRSFDLALAYRRERPGRTLLELCRALWFSPATLIRRLRSR